MEDDRFKHIRSDPKFRRIPKTERKVKIDKRFQSMFNNKNFKVNYTVDKRGRPVNHTSSEDLKRYYELSSEDSSAEDDKSEAEAETVEQNETVSNNHLDKLDSKHPTDKKVSDNIKKKLRNLNVDYARGESTLYSESSSDDESEDEYESESENIEHKWGEMDGDAERTHKATHRLAACNMDWDRIRAMDLMILFHSFLPAGGIIKSAAIYPSEFGKERMKEEDIKGPTELVNSENNDDENDIDNEEGSKYHMEKLRQYQLNRLKYYYAVITCDSEQTADTIYKECDGMEYESSATKIDLRFIPDDMTFDDEPKEICEELPSLQKYQPRFFTTSALQQAKVNLTWDETKPDRIEINQKLASGKIDDITNADLEEYLALSSDSDYEEEKDANNSDNPSNSENGSSNPINQYKALLLEIENEEQKKKRDVEMEITWGIDIKEKTDKLIKQKLSKEDNKTPFQKYLDKRKQKRKERKNKLDNSDEDSIPSDVDMNDPYFAEEFSNTAFKAKKNSKPACKINNEDTNDGELELLLMKEDEDKHFSLNKIQNVAVGQKSKKTQNKIKDNIQDNDTFQVNVEDERFSALFSSYHYNIDPSDPHYKKTAGMEVIINEKLKRRANVLPDEIESKIPRTEKKNAELSVLVKSVKQKTNAIKKANK